MKVMTINDDMDCYLFVFWFGSVDRSKKERTVQENLSDIVRAIVNEIELRYFVVQKCYSLHSRSCHLSLLLPFMHLCHSLP